MARSLNGLQKGLLHTLVCAPAGFQQGQFISPFSWKHLKCVKVLVLYLNLFLNLALKNIRKASIQTHPGARSQFTGWEELLSKVINLTWNSAVTVLCWITCKYGCLGMSSDVDSIEVMNMPIPQFWGEQEEESGVWFISTEIRTRLRGD